MSKGSRALLVTIALVASTVAHAQDSDVWVYVAESDNIYVEARKGSAAYDKLAANNAPVIKAVFRTKLNGRFYFDQKAVTLRDCEDGWGQVHTFDMTGGTKYSNDYVRDGGTVTARIGEFLCAVHAYELGKKGGRNNPTTNRNTF